MAVAVWVTLAGLLFDIWGARQLATGIFRLNAQGTEGRIWAHYRWVCRSIGFESEEQKQKAIWGATKSGVNLLTIGFVLQGIAALLSAYDV